MAKTLDGWQRFQRRLKAIPKAVREDTQLATVEAADEIAALQKQLAPIDDGNLRDSISVTPGGQMTPSHSYPGGRRRVPEDGAMITAGNSEVRYAHLVEYGTINANAQPFFFPGYYFGKKAASRKIKRAMSKAIRKTKNVR